MAKKIGEMLVERGLLTPEQVKQGLDAQTFQGGRVGSIWVELNYVQERDLMDALCAQKRAKPVKASLLKSVSKATLDLLPIKVATRYKVIPLIRENRRLTVAMVDPNDLLALDELQFISGSVIEPYLATERTILNALEVYYGVPHPRRDGIKTDIRPGAPSAKPLPPPPPPTSGAAKREEPEAFIDEAARTAADNARKFWAEQLKSGGSDEKRAAQQQAVAPTLEAVLAMPATAGASGEAPVADGNQLLVDEGDTVALVEAPDPLEEASRRLAKVEIRDDIADVLMWCTDGLFRRSALFIFQKGRTLGWTGQGESLTPDMVRKVVVPVEEISIFTLVRDTPTHYLGPLPRNAGNERFAETLGGTWPDGVLVIPFGIKGRALGCLYAEDATGELANIDLPLLFKLLQKAGLALEILLLRSKLVML